MEIFQLKINNANQEDQPKVLAEINNSEKKLHDDMHMSKITLYKYLEMFTNPIHNHVQTVTQFHVTRDENINSRMPTLVEYGLKSIQYVFQHIISLLLTSTQDVYIYVTFKSPLQLGRQQLFSG